MEHAFYFFGALLLVNAYALTRGGAPEKIVAACYLLSYTVTVIATRTATDLYSAVIINVLIIDICLAVALTSLSLYANRYWTMWAASLQIVAILAHLAMLILPGVVNEAYKTTLLIWSYASLPLLMAAIFRHQSRLATFGVDKNWSGSEPIDCNRLASDQLN